MHNYLSPNDVKNPVKVSVGYRDGAHWLEAYTEEMEKLGMPYVTVDLHVWKQWEAHCEAARIWDSFCHALGNEQYEKEHAHEA